MGDRLEKLVRKAFSIPEWYVLYPSEENKLFHYCRRAGSIPQARIDRMLDCSAICTSKICFFCSDIKPICPEYVQKRGC